jgi:hypothetical protein
MVSTFNGATSFDQNIGSWNVTSLLSASDMFNGVTLSTINYDALLSGWNTQTLQSGVTFSGGNSQYCLAEADRENMQDVDNWTITDAGLNCAGIFGPGGEETNLQLWLKANDGLDGIGAVTSWNDQSPNNRNIPTVIGDPQNTINVFNFNPAITFDGDDSLINNTWAANPAISSGDDTLTYITVFRRSVSENDGASVFEQSGTPLANNTRAGYLTANTTQGFVGQSNDTWTQTPLTEGIPIIGSVTLDNNLDNQAGSNINGIEYRNRDDLDYSTLNIGTDVFYVGSSILDENFTGEIAEIIIYDQDYASGSLEIQKINSYLALKYGISLDQTTPLDYLAADGITQIWDASLNSLYNNNIFGIGRDDSQNLDQKVAKSVDPESIVTLSLDNDFTSSNNDVARVTSFNSDQSFLTIANDGGATNTNSLEISSTYTDRISREWQVQNTGAVGPVNLKFDNFDETYVLLTDLDGDFSTDAINIGNLNAAGEITGVTLTDEIYFTLAKINQTIVTPQGSSSGGNGSSSQIGNIKNPWVLDEEVAACEASFNDISNHFADASVCQLFNLNIISGPGGTPLDPAMNYFPNNQMTRGEFLKVVLESYAYHNDVVISSNLNNPYVDVSEDSWVYKYATYGTEIGVLKGYGNGLAKLDQSITRAEALALITRILEVQVDEFKLKDNPFLDLESDQWYTGIVINGYKLGIIQGYDDKTFKANNSITRGEAAVMVSKVLKKY